MDVHVLDTHIAGRWCDVGVSSRTMRFLEICRIRSPLERCVCVYNGEIETFMKCY